MISVRNLVRRFGARYAVNDISFDVEEGVVLGFLGPNGAGKSTTMRVITGFLPPTSGSVVVNGYDVTESPVEVRTCIGYLPENAPCYGDMTVKAFLRFIAEMRGFRGKERNARADAAIEKCILQPVRNQTVDTLSKGYRQRTCFAQAILHDPPVLILDEPTEGLDPNQKKVVRDMMTNMGQEKVIILSTHVLEEVEAICTRVIIISDGKLVADSTPAELKRRSASYNAVTVRIVAPPEEVKSAFEGLADVARVDMLQTNHEQQTVRLHPSEQQPIAATTLDLARERNWLVTDIHTDGGRLDEVFRSLTKTEDALAGSRREA